MSTDAFPVPDYPGLLRLDGKGYIVVGGGLGMGRQTAHALSSCGAKVAVVDIDRERAAAVADEVGGVALQADATRRGDVERVVAEAETALGTVDGLVDIVGLAEWSNALDIPDDMWDRQFDMCLRHAYLFGQTVGRRLVAGGGGTMVFVASVSGIDSAPTHGAYGAAKAGLMSWVRTLAVELGPHKVRVNAVAPGSIHTPRLYGLDGGNDPDKQAASAATAPLQRMGEPHDIAGAALFLSTPLSSYITGRTIVVDGGVDALFPYMGITPRA
jgi:3-oxoacyl-[acyl-carrier protein] reductase